MHINLLNYFDETAARCPEKTAVSDGERSISFGELHTKAKALGMHIIDMDDSSVNRPIAVYIEKSIESIIADIGTAYSGNPYMNLDVNMPDQRIANILELIAPAFIITKSKYAGRISALFPAQRVIYIDEMALDNVGDEAIYARLHRLIDTDPFCLINTSGSTGTPKSVILTHRGFINYTTWGIEATGLRRDEVFGSLAPIVFDHFSYELCLIMVLGCTMVILPEVYASFPAKLMQYVADMKVTYIFWVPTIMVNIANMDLLARIPQPQLRMVWFAGEVFPTKQFNYWRKHLPGTRFVNLYGPTEITVDCTYYIVERELADEEPIPIGYPCRNTDILILNEENQLCSVNEPGELCVRGTSLALGYYNNPEKTADAFVQNPLNTAYPERIYRTGDIVYTNERGEIIFKGRNDTLIKHYGKRIELGEIEHVIINTLKLVKNGCAVYDYARIRIVFYYEQDEEIPVAQMRKAIGEHLPKYMIPSAFFAMEQLPRNTNGKIDRLKLKEMANE